MNKQELVQALTEGRTRFLETIQGLPEPVLSEPGVAGEWSVKDILAHLSRWEAELIALLYQAQHGHKPKAVHFGSKTADDVNAKWYQDSRDRPLERVQSDFMAVRQQTIRRVQEFPDADLNDSGRYPWLAGKPLLEWIKDDTIDHEEKHGAEIRSWRARRGV